MHGSAVHNLLMKENFEGIQKYNDEDIKFFDDLAKEYGLEQDEEHLIVSKNDKRAFIRKWREIPTKTGKIGIEKLIKKTLDELE